MKQWHLVRVLARGTAAVALCGGVVAGAAGVASATASTASSVSDCRDFMNRYGGLDEDGPAEWDIRMACRAGAHESAATCEGMMADAVAEHDLEVEWWVVEEACSRAD